MFTVFRPVMQWLMARQLRKELRELKSVLEADEEPISEVNQAGPSGV
ncbi:hypothetical protein [Haladaptatus cibarius]|nr:hypothetical protein [Haladaptatus cibarius]